MCCVVSVMASRVFSTRGGRACSDQEHFALYGVGIGMELLLLFVELCGDDGKRLDAGNGLSE